MSGKNRRPLCVARALWQPETEKPVAKFTVPQKKIDEASRRITFIISTDKRDRDGDIITQDGWDLEEYRKNPVVLWAHEAWGLPVARAENVAMEQGKLVSVAQFATREQYDFADTVYQLYKGGFLNAVSVGFVPTDMELIEGENPGDFGFRFLRQKLLEYSAVPIPSNSEALVVARSKGIDVKPCEGWIERILDEHAGGGMEQALNAAYIQLRGKLHPALTEKIAAANVAALRSKQEGEKMPDEDTRRKLTTGSGGEDNHTHSFEHGATETEPGGEDSHMHAISYSDDGMATLEPAEGHGHEIPVTANLSADMDEDEEDDEAKRNGDNDTAEDVAEATPNNNPLDPVHHGQPEGQRSVSPETTKQVTNWPQEGMNLPVSLLTSEYRRFPVAEARALKEDWPEIWALGEGRDNTVDPTNGKGLTETDILAREAWAAKHVDDFDLKGVVSQVRHLVRGSRGIEHMRKVLSLAKEKVLAAREEAKGLTPEQVGEIEDIVIQKGVLPALEKELRRYSGRVS